MTKRPLTVPSSRSSNQVMQTLAWLRKHQFKPVVVRPRSKAALSRDYASPSYRPPDDDVWRNGQYELGCALGPRQGGPTDVDLDCVEALFLAPRFFPHTDATFGRSSKPASHYLYRIDAAELDKRAFIDPIDKSTIIEIRADSHQTIVPGSIHEGTGELIEWSGPPFPEVTTVPAEQLISAAKRVAIATLIVRHAWFDGSRNETCKNLSGIFYHLEWTLEDAEALITAVMDYCGDDDKSRIPTVRTTYRRAAAGQKVTGAGTLRKQLGDDRVVDRILEWAGSPGINVVQQYNERFAVVSIEGKFRIADIDVAAGEPPVFLQHDDFLALQATDYSDEVNVNTGKSIPKSRLWLANPRRRQYRNVDFMPGVEDSTSLNLWTGWAIQPKKGNCDAWLELLSNIICGGDVKLCNWLLHWFANVLREPADKPLTAPVIIGEEGAGKSALIGYFGRILGRGFTVVTNDEHIHGKFNKHLASTLLLHSDEALYAGDRRHAGIIRSLITDEHRIYEQKGIDARQVKNYLRLILTSNEMHAAPAKPGDRRYTVITMDQRKITPKLWRTFKEELDNGGPAALHQHLLDMKYDPAVPRLNIKNPGLIGMKAANFSPIEAWWYDALYEGCVLPAYLAWATSPAQDPWPYVVSGPAMYASLCIRMRERGVRMQVPSDTLVALQLNRFVGTHLVRQRRYFSDPQLDNVPQMARHLGDRMSAVTNLPPLDDCRKAFERYMGQKIEWPGEDEQQPEEANDKPKY